MRWRELSQACRIYVLLVCLLSIPFAAACLNKPGDYSTEWLLLTLASVFVATINVRLPKVSAVISMGDVFVILVLMRFGGGPALITYWVDNTVGYTADIFRRFGLRSVEQFRFYQLGFNLACCTFSIWVMYGLYHEVLSLPLIYPVNLISALLSIALGWFVVNTGTLSLAISLSTNR